MRAYAKYIQIRDALMASRELTARDGADRANEGRLLGQLDELWELLTVDERVQVSGGHPDGIGTPDAGGD